MTTQAINPTLDPRLSFDATKALTAIGRVADVPAMVVVNPAMPANTLGEFISDLKAKPGKSYASPGNGTPNHLASERFKRAAGVDALHVPYKGGAPAVQHVMAGQVQFMVILAPEAMPPGQGGQAAQPGHHPATAFTHVAGPAHGVRVGRQGLWAGGLVRAAGTGRHAQKTWWPGSTPR